MEINEEEYFRRYKVGETFVYDLTAEGHSKAMVIDSDFKMTSQHDLTFLEVDIERQWWRFRLRELSNKLIKKIKRITEYRDMDPIVNAQDIFIEWLDSIKVKKIS